MAKVPRRANAPGKGGDAGETATGSRLSLLHVTTPTPCPHRFTRPTADDDLLVCVACGRITGALTRAGELELLRLGAWYGADPLAHDGGADYGIREPARPRLKVVARTAPLPVEPPAEPSRRVRTVSLA